MELEWGSSILPRGEVGGSRGLSDWIVELTLRVWEPAIRIARAAAFRVKRTLDKWRAGAVRRTI